MLSQHLPHCYFQQDFICLFMQLLYGSVVTLSTSKSLCIPLSISSVTVQLSCFSDDILSSMLSKISIMLMFTIFVVVTHDIIICICIFILVNVFRKPLYFIKCFYFSYVSLTSWMDGVYTLYILYLEVLTRAE